MVNSPRLEPGNLQFEFEIKDTKTPSYGAVKWCHLWNRGIEVAL